ncbi:hypothetical protein [Tropicimonas sp. S265A]|uniref:FliH/SctL family protein n=1 Tax=Tropicimonas sp. S265A TaxID=3415134 RepID=UPI003C7A206A
MAALALEEFGLPASADSPRNPETKIDPAKARMEGYESGYQAGWDDAVKSATDENTRIDAELARNLEELSFTFFEAQRHVSLSLETLVMTMAEKVLPALYREHFGALIKETLAPLIEDSGNLTVELLCAPSDLAQITDILQPHNELPLSIRAEPSFAQHQVRFHLGHEVHDIDGDALLTEIRTALETHFTQLQEVHANVS